MTDSHQPEGGASADAGWYPQATGGQRYWDGRQWTVTDDEYHAAHPTPTGTGQWANAAAGKLGGVGTWGWLGISVGGVFALIILLAVAATAIGLSKGPSDTAGRPSAAPEPEYFTSVEFSGLPSWLQEMKPQVSPARPEDAAVYVAVVSARRVTSEGRAEIRLEYQAPTSTSQGPSSAASAVYPSAPVSITETLAWIVAVDGRCGDPVAAPAAALEERLPLGARVLVIDNPATAGTAFMHVLPEGSRTPQVAPPQDSVNEGLVETGTWLPSSPHQTPVLTSPFDADQSKWALAQPATLSVVESQYVPLLIQAANESWTSTPQGEACGAKVAAAAAAAAAARKDEDDRNRAAAAAAAAAAAKADSDRKAAADEAARVAAQQKALAQQQAQQQALAEQQAQQQALAEQQAQQQAQAPQYTPPTSTYQYQPDTTTYGTVCGPGDRDGDGDGVCNER